MKNKSDKLKKLEKNRFSIFTTDLEKCYFCKMPKDDLHEIFGGCRRQTSMKFGLVIPVCRMCHEILTNDEKLKEKWRKIAEQKWLDTYKPYTINDFIVIFGKNYL